jgi:hypothetical protein
MTTLDDRIVMNKTHTIIQSPLATLTTQLNTYSKVSVGSSVTCAWKHTVSVTFFPTTQSLLKYNINQNKTYGRYGYLQLII